MKKQTTTPQPSRGIRYVISENIDDHTGYVENTPVIIIETLPDNYFHVQDEKGNIWFVGEEELTALPPQPSKEVLQPGQKYHIDMEFEGERLVDDVTVIEEPGKSKKVLVESPRLMANILIPLKELKPLSSREVLQDEPSKGKWSLTDGNNDDYYDIDSEDGRVCSVYIGHEAPPQNKANAELIVKAVNNYQSLVDRVAFDEQKTISFNTQIAKLIEKNNSLVDSNRELVGVCEELLNAFEVHGNKDLNDIPVAWTIQRLTNAINNANSLNK
jgi:hypothetical protein